MVRSDFRTLDRATRTSLLSQIFPRDRESRPRVPEECRDPAHLARAGRLLRKQLICYPCETLQKRPPHIRPCMTEPASSARPVAVAIRYLAIIAGGACLLLTAVCFAIACQIFIQTGVFAQSYAMVGSISGVLGILALKLASVWK